MTKSEAVKSTDLGTIRLSESYGASVIDSFMDSYEQEIFVCHDIIDKMRISSANNVTVTFEKRFLDKIIHSHILVIRKLSN